MCVFNQVNLKVFLVKSFKIFIQLHSNYINYSISLIQFSILMQLEQTLEDRLANLRNNNIGNTSKIGGNR
jgi:hypothetical protein